MVDNKSILEIASLAVINALETLGLSSGEISQSRAREIYGQDFLLLVRAGKIKPCRCGDGKTGTKWYRVADILAARESERQKSSIQLNSIK